MNEQDKIEFEKWRREALPKWTKKEDIMNFIIKKFKYKKYLEIGVRIGACFKEIEIGSKDGVDANANEYVNFAMASDEFFKRNKKKYDIIFIDGLHTEEQVHRDVINALRFLNKNGTIICHDINPPFEEYQTIPPTFTAWNGTSWKAFVKLRSEREDLEMLTIDTDWGLGVIRFGSQELIPIPETLEYNHLKNNRKQLLNLITVEDFYNKI